MNRNDDSSKNSGNLKRMVLVTAQAGCLTFLIAGLALTLGLWLDARSSSFPRWTLIALLGSAPLALGAVYLLVRRVLNRLRGEAQSNKITDLEKRTETRPEE